MTMTTFNVASISSSAVLVSLNISVWTGRKLDKAVSAEIDADKHTRVRAGNYHKNLMAGVRELEDVGKFAAETRNWFAYRTLPWGNEGTKIVDTASLFDFKQELSERERVFWNLVDDFEQTYTTAIQAAQFKLGALFNADEYPPVDVIRSKFGFRYFFSPVPEAGDFRVDIGSQGLAELQEQFNVAKQDAIALAMQDMWNRIREVTERLSRQLRVDKDDKGKLYQSTLDGALELCGMLKTLNLTNDPEMESVRKYLFSLLNGVDLKDLKKDDGARLAVKQELDDLISKFSI
jgi:hypothetical protein